MTLFLVIQMFYIVKVEKKFKLAFKSLSGIETIFINCVRIKAMPLKRKNQVYSIPAIRRIYNKIQFC